MYWRELYPTVEAAMRDERLGSLGKVKLSPQQKAAIQQAKADAKVAKISAKSARATAKSNVTVAKREAAIALAKAKADAKIAKFQQPSQTSSAAPASDSGFAQNMLALQQAASPMEFSSAGSGGSSGPAFQPSQEAAGAAPGLFESIPMAVWLGAGALLFLLLMKRK